MPTKTYIFLQWLSFGLLMLVASTRISATEAVQPRIVGGQDVVDPPGYMAFLDVRSPTGAPLVHCGGVYIGGGVVVTAAHCLEGAGRVDLWLDVPDGVLGEEPCCVSGGQFFSSRRFSKYPDYRAPVTNDIAVIHLPSPPEPSIEPVHVAIKPQAAYAVEHNINGFVLGWGLAGTSSLQPAEVLQEAVLQIDTPELCESLFQASFSPPEAIENAICAGGNNPFTDTCYGDSGGPLLISETDGSEYLLGITSFGVKECRNEDTPSGYTNVTAYRDWIFDHALVDESPEMPTSTRGGSGVGWTSYTLLLIVSILMLVGRWRPLLSGATR